MTELARSDPVGWLVDARTGEILEPTVENAAHVILVAREMKAELQRLVDAATDVLVTESERQGTRTLAGGRVVVTGGSTVEYDPLLLLEALAAAGCPQERVDEAVTAVVTYKVNRAVLRQLAGANSNYRTAIDQAARTVEKPYRATIKQGGSGG